MPLESLIDLFGSVTSLAVSDISKTFVCVANTAADHQLITKDARDKVVGPGGAVDSADAVERTKMLWTQVVASALSDWYYFWRLIYVLFQCHLRNVALNLLPSHYSSKASTRVVTNEYLSNQEENTYQILHYGLSWITNNSNFRLIALQLYAEPNTSVQAALVLDFLDKDYPEVTDDSGHSKYARPELPYASPGERVQAQPVQSPNQNATASQGVPNGSLANKRKAPYDVPDPPHPKPPKHTPAHLLHYNVEKGSSISRRGFGIETTGKGKGKGGGEGGDGESNEHRKVLTVSAVIGVAVLVAAAGLIVMYLMSNKVRTGTSR